MVRRQLAELVRERFGIEHSTLQVERTGQEWTCSSSSGTSPAAGQKWGLAPFIQALRSR